MTVDQTVRFVDNETLYPANAGYGLVVHGIQCLYPPAGKWIDQPKGRLSALSTPPNTNAKKYLSIFSTCGTVHNHRDETWVYRDLERDIEPMGDAR